MFPKFVFLKKKQGVDVGILVLIREDIPTKPFYFHFSNENRRVLR